MLNKSGVDVLLEGAPKGIQRYNQLCLHYNLLANAVYAERLRCADLFSHEFERFLVAVLIVFDMDRKMGKGLVRRYDPMAGGFASRLAKKLAEIRRDLEPIADRDLVGIDINEHRTAIVRAYQTLASSGEARLSEENEEFHVGATKILHFLNPEFFMIIDRNTATTLRTTCGIPFKNSTQPGYSGQLYLQSLSVVRDLIIRYGVEKFRALEPGTPLLRIFDKVAFAYSSFG